VCVHSNYYFLTVLQFTIDLQMKKNYLQQNLIVAII
jgi:hypothetical protein